VPEPRDRARVFGEVADLYDRRRPGYPAAVFDDVLAFVPGARDVLEIGCGTGKATLSLAIRGLRVVAVEPDPDMARVARANTAGRRVAIRVSRFEEWHPKPASADLIFAAQSLHWVDASLALPSCSRALRPRGGLAACWNVARYELMPLRDELDAAYRRFAPEIAGKATGTPVLHHRWRRAIEESRLFGPVDVRTYDWEQTYSAVEYTELLQTHSDHRTLPPARLAELLDAVATIIEGHDDKLRRPYRTELWLSRSTTQ